MYDGDGGRVQKTSYVVTESGVQGGLSYGSLFGNSQITSTPVISKYVGEMYEQVDNVGTAFIFLGSQRVGAINTNNGAPVFYHGDHLGSTNVMTDNSGTIIELLEYDPYGKIQRHDGASGNNRLAKQQFTGKKLDDETGLYYFGARYYDPLIGRFITPDTIVQDPFDPQTLNRYSYCGNNPINRIDLDGHKWNWGKFWKAAVGAIVGVVATILLGPAGFALVGSTMAGIIGGALGGAVAGGLEGGWKGALMGAAIGGALGGFASWGVAEYGKGFGYALLAAGGGYSAATGNIDSFAGGLLGGLAGAFTGNKIVDSDLFQSLTFEETNDLMLEQGKAKAALNKNQQKTAKTDPILKDKLIKKEFNKAWKDSFDKSGNVKGEQGGWIVQDSNGKYSVQRWAIGKQAAMSIPAKPSNAVAMFHTHPNTGSGWVQGPSLQDINVTPSFVNNGYVISKAHVYGYSNNTAKVDGAYDYKIRR